MSRLATLVLLAVVGIASLGDARASAAADAFRARVRVAQVGDERIAWYARGAGPPLVLAIGTGSTMAEWDPALLRDLAEHHRLILFDYPGVGESSKLVGGRTSFAALADTTARFMTAIGVARADVLGWSMGGFVAQQLAIRHPEAVRGLILAGTNPGGDHTVLGDDAAQRIDSRPDPTDAEILSLLYPRTAPGRAAGHAFLDRLDDASQSGEIPDDFDVPAATVRAQVAAEDPWMRSNANFDALGDLDVPTLVTAGRVDPVTPPQNARAIARRIPGARLALFAGAHAYLFQRHEDFADAVDDFVSAR